MSDVPKTCATCAHRKGFTTFARCDYSGTFVDITRKYGPCDLKFSGWVARQGIITRIKQVFVGVKTR